MRTMSGAESRSKRKFIRSELAEAASANAFAADFGAVVKFPSSNFSIGVALRNLGQRLRFLEESDALLWK